MTQKKIKASDVIGNSYYIYTLTSSNNTPSLNGTINITCKVTDVYGQNVTGKSITLYQNSTSQGAKTTDSNGSASWNSISMSSAGLQVFRVGDSKIEVFVDNKSDVGHTHSGYVSATKVTSWQSTPSDSNVPSEKLVKNTIDSLSIPTKTSDLTNDGDGTNVFVKNNDSRLTDSRTPTSHTHGNLTNDGKVGSTADYFVYTTTGGAITSKQKIGNITTSGAIGSTSGKPVITTTSGVLTTGSFGTSANTFAEGNHTHSSYVSTSDIADNLTTNDATKVLSAKQGKVLNDMIGSAITYIIGSGS